MKTNMQHEGNYDILFQFYFLNKLDSFVFFIRFFYKPLKYVIRRTLYKLFKKIDIIKKNLDIMYTKRMIIAFIYFFFTIICLQ